MFLLEEIVVEIAMIAAVIVAVLCLAYLTQLSVREQVYLWRLRRERTSTGSAVATSPRLEERRPAKPASEPNHATPLREKHV